MDRTRYGVHTGLQNTTPAELQALWARIEALGFDWISIWDHFYGATGSPGDTDCLEAVAMHAALAMSTHRVECGSLVYCISYRHPAVLAKAITTLDHLSNGRAAIGIGAGWAELEYRAFGIDFPSAGVRLDQLEEGVAIVRGLLRDEVTTFAGEWFDVTEARNDPRPVQAELPIWVGGGGERRTLRIAARYADGWNVAFAAPDDVRPQARRAAPALRDDRSRSGHDPLRRQPRAWRGPTRACASSSARSPTW